MGALGSEMGLLHSGRTPTTNTEVLEALENDRLRWEADRSPWRGLVYRGGAFFAITRGLINEGEYGRICWETSPRNPTNSRWVGDQDREACPIRPQVDPVFDSARTESDPYDDRPGPWYDMKRVREIERATGIVFKLDD